MKRKIKKRVLSLLMCVVMSISLLPLQINAEDASSSPRQIANGDYVYFGTDSIKWRVLDTDQMSTGVAGMFMITEEVFGTGKYGEVYFVIDDNRADGRNPNAYQGSDLQTWCTSFLTKLTALEQNTLLETIKDDPFFKSSSDIKYTASEKILNGDKVFSLSAEEAVTYFSSDNERIKEYEYDGGFESIGWFLRSPCDHNIYNTGMIAYDGSIEQMGTGYDSPARPACNIKQSSIIFISAAVDGKLSGNVGGSALISNTISSDNNEWKLTLKDESRDTFTASTTSLTTKLQGYTNWSVDVIYKNAKIGTEEYVSAALCDADRNILYYGNIKQNSINDTVTVNIPEGIKAGKYTLNIFSEQCNGDKKSDYSSEFQVIPLTIDPLPKETTPTASFTATGDNSGTLSSVTTSMKYSVDEGTSWENITDITMNITNVSPDKDVLIYQPGNGTSTVDSDEQKIDVLQAGQPTGLSGDPCSTITQNDGKINGVDSTMEYKLSTDSGWTEVNGTAVTGLSNGSYNIRVKASGTTLASTAETIIIGKHTCVSQGDWNHDETNHWNTCECGEKQNEASHAFQWVTDKVATATEAGSKHEECTVCGFKKTAVETYLINPTPTASFIATGDSSGTLSDVTTAMKYSVDGGISWEDITDTTMDITNVCADKDVIIYQPGNGISTTDSAEQIIDILQAGQPTGLNSDSCTTSAQNDGKINGVDSTMEYKLSTDSGWTEVNDTTVTGLSNGIYNIRVKASGTTLASTAETLTIGEHTCVAQEDWHCDEPNHWNTCICGETLNEAAHTFQWVTDKEATTTETGLKHEECTVCGYKNAGIEIPATEDEHTCVAQKDWHCDEPNHWNTCICGKKLNEASHTFQWVTDKEATESETGLKHEECTVCGYKKAAVEIPATEPTPTTPSTDNADNENKDNDNKDSGNKVNDNKENNTSNETDTTSPQTGVNSNVLLWFALFLVSGGMIFSTSINAKRKKKSE